MEQYWERRKQIKKDGLGGYLTIVLFVVNCGLLIVGSIFNLKLIIGYAIGLILCLLLERRRCADLNEAAYLEGISDAVNIYHKKIKELK